MAVALPATSPAVLPRVRSLMLALAMVWVCGTFDLMMTHSEARAAASFVELNPVARAIVGEPLYVLAAYKYGLLAGASIIFLKLRTHRQSEWGAWFLAGSHSVLVAYWCVYFGFQTVGF